MASTPTACDFGWHAVDATLKGTDGKTYRLFDLNGPNGLVIVFICNHCPYVKAVIDRAVRDAANLKPRGIGFVAVNANDSEDYPEDSFERMKAFADKHRFVFPYLHDEDQALARAYGAVCTPDFFGFNFDLELQYRGRLDEKGRQSTLLDGGRRELVEAMTLVAQTGRGPRAQVASIGCSIK